jgi:hypothetical protein
MENAKKITVSLDELYPIIKEKIESGGTVQLPITGTSMLPLLVWGRDTVEIVKCEKAKRYDIIFYRRDDGAFVLHRIVGKNENGFILCGDNQVKKEYGITEKHIIAVVKNITRKGKTFNVNKFSYKIYVKLWTLILPIRNLFLVPMRKIKGLFK